MEWKTKTKTKKTTLSEQLKNLIKNRRNEYKIDAPYNIVIFNIKHNNTHSRIPCR